MLPSRGDAMGEIELKMERFLQQHKMIPMAPKSMNSSYSVELESEPKDLLACVSNLFVRHSQVNNRLSKRCCD